MSREFKPQHFSTQGFDFSNRGIFDRGFRQRKLLEFRDYHYGTLDYGKIKRKWSFFVHEMFESHIPRDAHLLDDLMNRTEGESNDFIIRLRDFPREIELLKKAMFLHGYLGMLELKDQPDDEEIRESEAVKVELQSMEENYQVIHVDQQYYRIVLTQDGSVRLRNLIQRLIDFECTHTEVAMKEIGMRAIGLAIASMAVESEWHCKPSVIQFMIISFLTGENEENKIALSLNHHQSIFQSQVRNSLPTIGEIENEYVSALPVSGYR